MIKKIGSNKKENLNELFLLLLVFIALSAKINCQEAVPGDNITTNDSSENATPTITYPVWLNSSPAEYEKFLSDKYNYFITPKGNKMWVCSMNLAWNELKRGFLNNQNATFYNLTPLQARMVDNLNSDVFRKEELSEDAYYITSGFGQETLNRINLEVKEKFPLRTLPDLNYKLNPQDFISFAYLFKNFKFPVPFSDFTDFKFKGVKVRAFQNMFSKQRKQLYYKYYNNKDDFMVGIRTRNENDEIFLWKTNVTDFNKMKMSKFMQMFNMFYNLESKPLARFDKFIMPVIDLDYTRSYKEMLNIAFSNEGFEKYKISDMIERLKLKVTKEGVLLEAEAVIIAARMAAFSAKYFYLDNDFWIILKEKNKTPYLISLISAVSEVWVE